MKTCHVCHAYYRGDHCESCHPAKPRPCVGDTIVYPGDPLAYTIRELALTPDGPIALIESDGTSANPSTEWVLIDDLQEVDHRAKPPCTCPKRGKDSPCLCHS